MSELEQPTVRGAPAPQLSVVIPTFERNDLLAECLKRLAPGRQDGMVLMPANGSVNAETGSPAYEVIVSDAGIGVTAEQFLESTYPWAKWIAAPGCCAGANRNAGSRHARGRWLVFVDDDCLPDPGWLAAISDALSAAPVDVVEGQTLVPAPRDNPFYYAPYNTTGGFFWTCNLAVRQSAFLALGGFDADLVEQFEDAEFAHRVLRRGLKTAFVPTAVVWHPMRRLGWQGIVRQTLRLRWQLLYSLKTGRSSPLGTSPVLVLSRLTGRQAINLLRGTWHLASQHEPARWRSRWFWQLWYWLTFPVLLPYLWIWELRFRRMLIERELGLARQNRRGVAVAGQVERRS